MDACLAGEAQLQVSERMQARDTIVLHRMWHIFCLCTRLASHVAHVLFVYASDAVARDHWGDSITDRVCRQRRVEPT